MTAARIKRFVFYSVYAILCLAIILLQSTGLMTLNISTASALLILPLTVYAGFYFGGISGAVFGLGSGVLLDVYSSTVCYNAVSLTLIGFICGMLMEYLFNRNIAAACVLNSASALLYFFVKWLAVYAFIDPAPQYILIHFSVPSAVYTAVCGVLIYFLVCPVLKRMPAIEK